MTPDSTALAVNRALAEGDTGWAFKMVVQARDHLRATLASVVDPTGPDATSAECWRDRHTRIDDDRYDVLLRSIVAREFTERGLPAPAWATGAHLEEPWLLVNPFLGPERTRQQTPPWLTAEASSSPNATSPPPEETAPGDRTAPAAAGLPTEQVSGERVGRPRGRTRPSEPRLG